MSYIFILTVMIGSGLLGALIGEYYPDSILRLILFPSLLYLWMTVSAGRKYEMLQVEGCSYTVGDKRVVSKCIHLPKTLRDYTVYLDYTRVEQKVVEIKNNLPIWKDDRFLEDNELYPPRSPHPPPAPPNEESITDRATGLEHPIITPENNSYPDSDDSDDSDVIITRTTISDNTIDAWDGTDVGRLGDDTYLVFDGTSHPSNVGSFKKFILTNGVEITVVGPSEDLDYIEIHERIEKVESEPTNTKQTRRKRNIQFKG